MLIPYGSIVVLKVVFLARPPDQPVITPQWLILQVYLLISFFSTFLVAQLDVYNFILNHRLIDWKSLRFLCDFFGSYAFGRMRARGTMAVFLMCSGLLSHVHNLVHLLQKFKFVPKWFNWLIQFCNLDKFILLSALHWFVLYIHFILLSVLQRFKIYRTKPPLGLNGSCLSGSAYFEACANNSFQNCKFIIHNQSCFDILLLP